MLLSCRLWWYQQRGRREIIIGISQLIITMRIRAIFAKLALALLIKVFATLSFMVVIRDIHHLHLYLNRQWLQIKSQQNMFKKIMQNSDYTRNLIICPSMFRFTYLFSLPEFMLAMSKVASTAYVAVFGLLEMLAELSLKQVIELCNLCSDRSSTVKWQRLSHHSSHQVRVHLEGLKKLSQK